MNFVGKNAGVSRLGQAHVMDDQQFSNYGAKPYRIL